jgi:ectoine hydroxylase-related dioxygenase (phytanoyl-CoA dioxygenase family)
MKPPQHPEHPDWAHPGFIHWDVDTTRLPIPFGVQGVLNLTDTGPDQGGFQCVPGIHARLEEFVKSQPADRDPRRPDLTGLDIVPVPAKAGDLVVWHRGLLHGNGLNRSDRPRLAQYITMSPVNPEREGFEEHRRQRIKMWRERLGPAGPAFPGDPRNIERERYQTAELTPLGRKLLGLDLWTD